MNETHTTSERLPYAFSEPLTVVELENRLRGEKESRPRVVVRIERRSTKLLNLDNLWGSVKPLVDCLRAAKLIYDDDIDSIDLSVTQSKVKTRKEHETILTLEYGSMPTLRS
jgi:hypothetical protein